ncbi:aldo/keto reductase, partial [Listeria monocytogenes]|uniref:aldo/keto reductase n=1 Tax=Listeria monocytogenes TaxID=1639 RepID=UPI001F5AAD92
VAALDAWERVAAAEGIDRAELAYRWIFYHSQLSADHGDAVIVGASRPDQLRATVAAVRKGPLSADAAQNIAAI